YGPICSIASLLIPFISFWRDGGFNLWLSFGEQENQIEFADVAPHTDRRVVNGDSMFYAILRSINQHSSTNRVKDGLQTLPLFLSLPLSLSLSLSLSLCMSVSLSLSLSLSLCLSVSLPLSLSLSLSL